MKWPTCPAVYEINTWPWLTDLSREANHRVTLGNVPDAELNRLADYGFDAIWLMGVWQRSPDARKVARERPSLQTEYRRALPDYVPEDAVASPYAIHSYEVDSVLGGNEELDALRQRLRQFGLRLILDFVPNHPG
jgi:glycosidase